MSKPNTTLNPEADPGFQVRWGALKKNRDLNSSITCARSFVFSEESGIQQL